MTSPLSEICPEFNELEDEVLQEFYSDVKDCVIDINNCIESINDDPQVLINRLFRSIHTIKGNCNMVFLEPFVSATHLMEEIVQDIRGEKYFYHPNFCHLFIAGTNTIDELLQQTLRERTVDLEQLVNITKVFEQVRLSNDDIREDNAKRAELSILDKHYTIEEVALNQMEGEAFSIFSATDMEFFHYLSECQLAVDETHSFRMSLQIELALLLNQQVQNPANEEQLTAAIYVYEFFHIVKGNDQYQIRRRVFSAGSLLARVPGWSEASQLIFQTHETLNGTGFPKKLTESEILSAAKIIHLVELFASHVIDNKEDGYKASLFKAVKAVNGLKEIHYKATLIDIFNSIIKSHYLNEVRW